MADAPLTPDQEHPAARRMRERFEAEHGDMHPIASAIRRYYNVREMWSDSINRDREKPVTEEDLDAAEQAVYTAVRAFAAAPPSPPVAAPAEPAEAWIVVKEHVWHHEDGQRPTLAYLWPSEFDREVHPTAASASAFIKEHELPLGWVRMKLMVPQPPRPGTAPLSDEQCEVDDPSIKMNHAQSEAHGALALVYVDFGTKWLTITGTCIGFDDVPSVDLEREGAEHDVAVSFPSRAGWKIVSASTSKYTLTVVLKAPDGHPTTPTLKD